ncbi:MAG: DUF3833 domain-containing protein [Comamonadaceae bacterium]|nr:DUF3833 domain-containing protein [Comamonadaceae bacterium]
MNRRLLLTTSALALLAGCASAPVPEDYAAEKPVLDLKTYFNGPLTAHGLFTDRAGKVKRRFVVKLQGRWQGDVGTLEEDFLYSDGKTERRVWTITALGNGRYRGTAADVIGEAQGLARGNALRWSYTLRLPVDDTTYDVQFDDWMYLMDDRVMLNKARMSKFGIDLGEVTLSFYKP